MIINTISYPKKICNYYSNYFLCAKKAAETGCLFQSKGDLLLNNLEDLHGAGLYADTAGNALGGGLADRSDHNLHGADLCTLTAGGTQLLVNHVNTGLGILGDSTELADLGALAALDAGHRLGTVALGNDLNAGKIRIKLLVEGHGTCPDALKTCHAFTVLFNGKLLHEKAPLFFIFRYILYRTKPKIAMPKIKFRREIYDKKINGHNYLSKLGTSGNTIRETNYTGGFI